MTETIAAVTASAEQVQHALEMALIGDLGPLVELPDDTAFAVAQEEGELIGPFRKRNLSFFFGSCGSAVTAKSEQQPPQKITIRPNIIGSIVVTSPVNTVQ